MALKRNQDLVQLRGVLAFFGINCIEPKDGIITQALACAPMGKFMKKPSEKYS